tara:strand:+ start:831 stop:1283 length:453 start_codon:yes stop_codon:yes gene_type:complete
MENDMSDKEIDSKLNEVLEVKDDDYHPIEIQSNTELEYIDTSEERNHDIKNDYEFRREKLYQLVSKGEDALENLLTLAKESDHPRAYEVFGQLMKANMDAVKDLTDLQKDMNKIENEKGGKGPNKVVNNNSVFVGNTNELLEMLKGKNRE